MIDKYQYKPNPEAQSWIDQGEDAMVQAWKDRKIGGHTTNAGNGKVNLHLYTIGETRAFIAKISDLDPKDLER